MRISIWTASQSPSEPFTSNSAPKLVRWSHLVTTLHSGQVSPATHRHTVLVRVEEAVSTSQPAPLQLWLR